MTDSERHRRWRERYETAPKRSDVDFVTQSSAEVEPLYTSADVGGSDDARQLGYPGEFP
jgi:hypothetical protein